MCSLCTASIRLLTDDLDAVSGLTFVHGLSALFSGMKYVICIRCGSSWLYGSRRGPFACWGCSQCPHFLQRYIKMEAGIFINMNSGMSRILVICAKTTKPLLLSMAFIFILGV